MRLEDLGYLSIGSQMRRVYEKLQFEGDSIYKNMGIPFKSSWFPIYYVLSQTNRALTVMELTENISYSRITVKNVIRELEKAGYVDILPNPTDNRSKLIQLTAKGKGMEPELQSIWRLFHKHLENLFGKDDFLHQLIEINHKLNTTSLKKEIIKEYTHYIVRNAKETEFERIGELLVEVYSALSGFPKKEEQPQYYEMLRNVGKLTENKNVELLAAVSEQGNIGGAVVYFNDMKDYGSGGTATQEKNACGFRLLGVDAKTRGLGIGKMLTEYCVEKGKKSNAETMVIHTTKSMKTAWKMYERLGFKRAQDLDFMQGNLPVFGFRLQLK
ncbi:bifunctional helix-turn-helix transcriptional regulator/GNAT family N-acetyltransferase [Muricauda sp. SCSIO 64092]|uniref:bifunctional helix-turn-helix transcriptional regulator/GNAT family N-acetyltransferase n=1 Tax=Allomuricauda sp. SCSIO 64092 TaxID=2908842 RepID=UPI001FF56468|nr:bifunctional helix-turn-helix transcriptional regulator/GNAT family N-acetyltransferase [Muricauda sp. SCSIO 64092]UOY06814.1 bifunctional helix-turn-helix transcriptional regulator/GNAT family N-acetyltransferase [Muricauda sp. SCSIO 64092]